MSDEDDIILSELDDDELVQQMHDDLYDGLQDEIVEGVEILLSRGWTPYDVLTKALVEGMTIVGIDFRDGILFVPEVLMAANAMKAGMGILRPLLAETGAPRVGKIVIGTVKGDIHDIGKNLVSMMLEGAGFEVIDLGINNPVENYLEALEEHQLMFFQRFKVIFNGVVDAKIDNLKSSTFQHHRHQIFPNIVNITFHCANDNLTHTRRPRFSQQRAQNAHPGFHGICGHQDFRHK